MPGHRFRPDCLRLTPPSDTPLRTNGPIKHVFFIVRENRNYDQVLGDLGHGDGDPKLAIFGRRLTPNMHALAGELCGPHDRICGPEPRRAPANKICFSGVGNYTMSNGKKTPQNLHILMNWQKQGNDWKLLSRAATKL